VNIHEHYREHHKAAIGVLSAIARDTEIPFALVRGDFIEGEPEITALFWQRLHGLHPGRFTGVTWCEGCRMFQLEEALH